VSHVSEQGKTVAGRFFRQYFFFFFKNYMGLEISPDIAVTMDRSHGRTHRALKTE